MKTGPKPLPLAVRFWRRVNKNGSVVRPDLGPCWEWTGALNSHGYGNIGADGSRKTLRASRVAWEIEHGPIPDGLHVCHKCDHRKCVRPDHLFLGTPRDNIRDAMSKGRIKLPKLRLEGLARGRAIQRERALARPVPQCIHCGGPARPRRKGRCHACHEYFRRRGVDRPPDVLAGLGNKGSRNARALLTEPQVADVFRRVEGGERQVDVARSLGVSKALVNNIVHGRAWRHLDTAEAQRARARLESRELLAGEREVRHG